MIDQHLHSNFSPDSIVEIKDYIKRVKKLGHEYLNVTDHFDYLDNLRKYDGYDYMQKMRDQYNYIKNLDDEVYPGIEVGYNKSLQDIIEKFLGELDHSIILLSIHDNDDSEIRYCFATSYKIPTHDVVKIYFNQMYEAVTSGIDYDVLSHMGYIFRYTEGEVNPMDYMEDVKKILQVVVENNKALEINTGCFRRGAYDANQFYSNVLKIYQSLGGFKISLGSDAHALDDYCSLFEETKSFLKSNGIKEITYIKNREHQQVSI